MSGGTTRPPAGPVVWHGVVQTELAEWVLAGPGCWERRVRGWGSVPPDDVS